MVSLKTDITEHQDDIVWVANSFLNSRRHERVFDEESNSFESKA